MIRHWWSLQTILTEWEETDRISSSSIRFAAIVRMWMKQHRQRRVATQWLSHKLDRLLVWYSTTTSRSRSIDFDRWVDQVEAISSRFSSSPSSLMESNICPKYWWEILKEMRRARMFAMHLSRNSPYPNKQQQWLQSSTSEWLVPWSSRKVPANNQSCTLPSPRLRACQDFACSC